MQKTVGLALAEKVLASGVNGTNHDVIRAEVKGEMRPIGIVFENKDGLILHVTEHYLLIEDGWRKEMVVYDKKKTLNPNLVLTSVDA